MKKERYKRFLLPAFAVGGLLTVEFIREVVFLPDVAHNPALQNCIEEKAVFGLQDYEVARQECFDEAGLHQVTPLLDAITSVIAPSGK